MPTISVFYGIIILMHIKDHNPPHIHAIYGEKEATFLIENGKKYTGNLPNRAIKMVQEFIRINKEELLKMWTNRIYKKLKGIE